MLIYVFSTFFFFKQKTAYEMRISDWSSDVCSSDLRRVLHLPARQHRQRVARSASRTRPLRGQGAAAARRGRFGEGDPAPLRAAAGRRRLVRLVPSGALRPDLDPDLGQHAHAPQDRGDRRSEEHTSELQSLMRISYSVFCLKNKNTTIIHLPYR